MMKRTLLILLASVGIARAQEQFPGGEPVRRRAPEFSRWVITVNPQRSEGGNAAAFDRKVIVTKTREILHERISNHSGQQRERWVLGRFQYSQFGPKKEFLPFTRRSISPEGDPDRYVDYSATDFPGFEWVSPEYFTGIKKANGRECLVYSKGDMTAFVALDNRLPVGLVKDGKQRIYEFQPAPQSVLTPPPAVMEDYRKRAGAPAPKD